MSRNLTEAFASALAQPNVQCAMLVEGEFASGTIHIWTGLGALDWNGQSWTGLGTLIGVDPIEETDDVKASGIAISLSGVPASQISLALSELRLNKPGSIRLALFEPGLELGEFDGTLLGEPAAEWSLADDDGSPLGDPATPWAFGQSEPEIVLGMPEGGLIGDPKIVFKGRLDVGVIDDGAESCTVALTYEHELIDLERPREWRYTDQHQKRFHPNDRGLEYIAGLQNAEVNWGRR